MQGIFKSAELKAAHLKQDMTSHSAEATKLAERLAAAQTQYSAGLAKLVATNKQLQALQSQVRKMTSICMRPDLGFTTHLKPPSCP